MMQSICLQSRVFVSPGARLQPGMWISSGRWDAVSMRPLARCNRWTDSSTSKAQNTRT